ncbi:MAG: guanylate kinase [Planctomycetes bacterium]|nr:guanylate kinase [Planctomycetota bacterium]
MTGRLFVFSGPSGSGKSTIISTLRNRLKNLGYSVSHTSRGPRSGERDGIDYHFVNRETFDSMIADGGFVEWAEVYHCFYGTSIAGLEKQTSSGFDVLLDLDVQGAKNIKEHFDNSVLIHLLPPSLEALEKRLKDRGTDDEDIIGKRMETAPDVIKNCVWYDYVVINDDLENAVLEVQAIITSERCRTARRMKEIEELFDIPTP